MILTTAKEGDEMQPLEFYRNIPAKQCSQCQEEMTEMYDCYYTECERCSNEVE